MTAHREVNVEPLDPDGPYIGCSWNHWCHAKAEWQAYTDQQGWFLCNYHKERSPHLLQRAHGQWGDAVVKTA